MGILDNWEIKLSKVFINHFLGAYLDQPLQDQQIHKANGTFICRDIHLNNHVINHLLADQFIPLEVKVAYIEQISVCIPWITKSNVSTFEIYKLEVELHPLNRSHNMNADVVLDSMISSMTKGDHSIEDSMMASFQSQAQSMPISTDELAKLIDSLIANISVTLRDTRIRLEYSPSNIDVGIGLDLSIKHIFISKGSLSDEELAEDKHTELSFNANTKFSDRDDFSGIHEQTPSETSSVSSFFARKDACRGPSSNSSISSSYSKSHSINFDNKKSSNNGGSAELGVFCKNLRVNDLTLHWDLFPQRSSDMTESATPERVTQVELALLSGQQNIRVVGRASGSPRLKVDLNLGPMYVFLSPDCINWLSLLCQGFTSHNMTDACSLVDQPCGYPGMESCRGYSGLKKWSQCERACSTIESQVFKSCTSVLPSENSMRFYPDEDNVSDITDLTLGTDTTAQSLRPNQHFEATGEYPANISNSNRDWDKSFELLSLGLSLRFLSVILLHEEPKVKPKPEDLQPPDICDLSELKRLASRHFGQARHLRVEQEDFDMSGFDEASFLITLRQEIAEICSSLDHISLLCRLTHFKVVKSESNLHEIYKVSASIHSMELVETLYGNNQAKGITIPDNTEPEFAELLTFNEPNEDPCLKALIEINYPSSRCPGLFTSGGLTKIKRLVRLELGECCIEVDRSITDRINRLLNNRVGSHFSTKIQTLNTSSLFGAQNNFNSGRMHSSASDSDFMHDQSSFLAEPQYGSASSTEYECDTTIIVDSKSLQLTLLFPVPDLRKHPLAGRPHQLPKLPWWRRNLRDEKLVLKVDSIAVNSKMSSNDTVFCFEINCADLAVNLTGSDFTEPIPVLKVSQDGPEILSFLIRSQPSVGTRFVPKPAFQEDSLMEYVDLPDFENVRNTPFVTQRTHSESATVNDGSQKKSLWPQETHYPVDSEGMRAFTKSASEYCLLTVELRIPSLVLNLENKHVLDLLYERTCCDLLLWESLVPPEDPLMCDNQGIPLNIYGLPETLLNSKSSLSGGAGGGHDTESDLEDEASNSPYQSGSFSQHPNSAPDCFGRKSASMLHVTENPSLFCCSVKIHHGVIRADLPGNNTSPIELVVDFSQGDIFFENGHNGDAELAYCTIQSDRISLYEADSTKNKPSGGILHLQDYLTQSKIAQMKPLIEPAPKGLKYAFNSGYSGEEMLMVAIEFREKKKSKKCHEKFPSPLRQDIRVAVRFSESLYHHRLDSCSGWIAGLQTLLTLRDPPIEGYLPPDTVSIVHCHVNRLAVAYNAASLNLSALFTCENITLTSNVYLNSDSSIFHVFLENSGLFLASLNRTPDTVPKHSHINSDNRLKQILNKDVRSHFVCVAELDHFELSIAFLDTFGKLGPTGMDIRCLNNMLTLHLCADSLDALVKVIQHITQEQASQEASASSLESDDDQLDNDQEQSSLKHKSQQLSESDKKELQNMITDAIESDLERSDLLDSRTATPEDEEADDDFVLVTDAQLPMKEDTVECLLQPNEQLVYNANHFQYIAPKNTSPFSDPEKYPTAVYAFTIYDASLVCKIYAGFDFHDRERDGLQPSSSWEKDLGARHLGSASNLLQSQPLDGKSRSNSARRSFGAENLSAHSSSLSASLQRNAEFTASTPVISGIKFQGGKTAGPIRFSKKHSDIISLSCPPSSNKLVAGHSPSEPLTSQARQRWCQSGGAGRHTEKSMEFQICKLNYRFSKFPDTSSYAARHVLSIRQLEIRDLIDTSSINKLLCLHNSDSIPYNEKAPMVLFKILTERVSIDEGIDNLESDIKVSIQPLWLNIDQDALEFIMEFCDNFNHEQLASANAIPDMKPTAQLVAPAHQSTSYPILSMNSINDNSLFVTNTPPPILDESPVDERAGEGSESNSDDSISDDKSDDESVNVRSTLNSPMHNSQSSNTMFIRTFTFTPDLHIRIDYCGKKIGLNQGPLMGLAAGLTRLNNSEVVIRRLRYERGFSGVDRLIQAIVADWSADIPTHIKGILSGLGPMHEVIQIATGIRDLFFMPVKQYNEDGGVLRGLKGGARSFSTSTLWALLELSSQGVRFIQFIAENAYDFVTPGPSLRRSKPLLRPPANLPEGMSNAALAVRSGFSRVAVDISRATNHPDKEGIAGTMGELLRQVGPTIVTPIYVLTEALMQILIGLRTQIRPLSKKEDEHKYKDTYGL